MAARRSGTGLDLPDVVTFRIIPTVDSRRWPGRRRRRHTRLSNGPRSQKWPDDSNSNRPSLASIRNPSPCSTMVPSVPSRRTGRSVAVPSAADPGRRRCLGPGRRRRGCRRVRRVAGVHVADLPVRRIVRVVQLPVDAFEDDVAVQVAEHDPAGRVGGGGHQVDRPRAERGALHRRRHGRRSCVSSGTSRPRPGPG